MAKMGFNKPLHSLKIEPIKGNGFAHNVILDGKPLRATHVEVSLDAQSIPQATITVLCSDVEIELPQADVDTIAKVPISTFKQEPFEYVGTYEEVKTDE